MLRVQWDLVCSRRPYFLLISTALMVGLGLGSSIFCHLSDIYGRKRVKFPLVGLMLLCHTLTAFVYSWPLMVLARFCTGIFAGIIFNHSSINVHKQK